jgi:hypothetical protein
MATPDSALPERHAAAAHAFGNSRDGSEITMLAREFAHAIEHQPASGDCDFLGRERGKPSRSAPPS